MDRIGSIISRKIQLRLIWPLLFLLFLNSLDRVNVSFGALQMNREIGLTPKTFGLGVGLFFVGYILFQVPGTALLKRLGARLWVSLVVLVWGAIAAAMAFVTTPQAFYVLRVLLGVAEAGFAPGVIFLCTQWMPRRHRAGAISTTMLAIPASIILGGPLSGWLMTMVNPLGWSGWRWMFLAEGLPTVLLAFGCLIFFVDTPTQARWLTGEEKAWLAEELGKEQAEAAPSRNWLRLLISPRVWAASLAWFALLGGAYGVIFWLPQVIRQMAGGTALDVGLLSALPWIGVAAGMILVARSSDRTQERFLHVAGASLLGAAGLACAASVHDSRLAMACLVVGGFGMGGAQGAFWTVPPTFLGRMTAMGGITLINMMGNLSGVVGPILIGVVREKTGAFNAPVYAMAGLLALGGCLILLMKAAPPRLTPRS